MATTDSVVGIFTVENYFEVIDAKQIVAVGNGIPSETQKKLEQRRAEFERNYGQKG